MQKLCLLMALFMLSFGAACGTAEPAADGGATAATPATLPMAADETEVDAAMQINVQIGDKTFSATLADTAAARELGEMLREEPLTVGLSDYGGFEKVGPLGRSLTAADSQTTTAAGDIVLYNSDQIVMFYGSNSWSYTRLARIDDLTGWEEALGGGSITAVFTPAE